MARRLSVSISKGGTGKTTTAVNLAHGLALAGYRVLLVDTDAQGQAGAMLGQRPDAGLAGVRDLALTVQEDLGRP